MLSQDCAVCLRSENAALANYCVFFVLHLVVFLVAFYQVDIAYAGVFINFVSKRDLVAIRSFNCSAGRISSIFRLLYISLE